VTKEGLWDQALKAGEDEGPRLFQELLEEILAELHMGQLTIGRDPALIFPTVEKAEKAAKALKEGDPDWDYRVMPDPKGSGRAIIHIYDEAGDFVGVLSTAFGQQAKAKKVRFAIDALVAEQLVVLVKGAAAGRCGADAKELASLFILPALEDASLAQETGVDASLEDILTALAPTAGRLPACSEEATDRVRTCAEGLGGFPYHPLDIAECQVDEGCSVHQTIAVEDDKGNMVEITTFPEVAEEIHAMAEEIGVV